MYSLTLSFWMTAFIGTGLLAAIPGTVMMLAQMGVLVTVRNHREVPEAVDSRTIYLADLQFEPDPDEVLVEDLGVVPVHDLLLDPDDLAADRNQRDPFLQGEKTP
jgi:hypothetical protein